MTQEQLAKKWVERWGNGEADTYDAICGALQEQEQIHPWADSFERYQQVLDDFQKVVAWAYDYKKAALQENDRYSETKLALSQVLDDFQAEVSGWDNGVYEGTREDWIDRCQGAQQWKDYVIDALVVNWAYEAEHENDPKKAVDALRVCEIQMAMDPMVSKEMYDALRAAFQAGMRWTISWDRDVTQESVDRGFDRHLQRLSEEREKK
jgi:hypothetical protein